MAGLSLLFGKPAFISQILLTGLEAMIFNLIPTLTSMLVYASIKTTVTGM
jgi:hypothetical protein